MGLQIYVLKDDFADMEFVKSFTLKLFISRAYFLLFLSFCHNHGLCHSDIFAFAPYDLHLILLKLRQRLLQKILMSVEEQTKTFRIAWKFYYSN